MLHAVIYCCYQPVISYYKTLLACQQDEACVRIDVQMVAISSHKKRKTALFGARCVRTRKATKDMFHFAPASNTWTLNIHALRVKRVLASRKA